MKATFKIIGIGILSVLVIAGFYFYLTLPDVSGLKTNNPRTTALMVQRYREAKKSDQKFRIRQQWIDFEAIPKLLRETVRVTEDASFYQHKGVDFAELKEALKKNWKKGEYARSGSTITQQVTKSFLLTPERSYKRKLREAILAYRIDKTISKEDILYLYLNQSH